MITIRNWNIFHKWKEQIGTYFMSGREFRNCLAQTTFLKVFRDFRASHVVVMVKICTGAMARETRERSKKHCAMLVFLV